MNEPFIQIRDSEHNNHYRMWLEFVEDGATTEERPICACKKGHKSPDLARACRGALAELRRLEANGWR